MTQPDLRPADLWYTVRRSYVDEFFTRRVAELPAGTRVIDLGGKKRRKRGRFDISRYDLDVVYANADPRTEPDFCCDAADVPVPDGAYDAVVCSELLEHVPHPQQVLDEAHRLLRPGGVLLLTAPFHCDVHPDPKDYGRYTETWLAEALARAGFVGIEVEPQGCFFTVLADMVKRFAAQNLWPRRKLTRRLFLAAVSFWLRLSLKLERRRWHAENRIVRGYTTGYGVRAVKPHSNGETPAS